MAPIFIPELPRAIHRQAQEVLDRHGIGDIDAERANRNLLKYARCLHQPPGCNCSAAFA
ncbi:MULTISPECIES: hypothetical protein [Cupriavidus]|jgi:hypothetical protein|uniref:hypothetical protein n=1 Tax=Cupriavidus TaxID=106589 RepID=UPI0012E048E1|nr:MULTISPECIES: hypothetical protein [Cupriavidus]